ncbi:PP0621 family protein [Hydrogenophaga sp. PAMC20947]|uniref:PP0621 family protein n=1 Tax=Hydrogenophaga sp. PAMC20947 TaxID=2565558 RepID=UPI00109E20ED|nr:PP0621 family protein [Hydrogenophaga sp. PAMC20947]QCB48218.1 hypothetical protein E5678_20630 [Hydrogenophaga sp. PAMC20947]
MKYLLVLSVVLIGFWVWRNNRREDIQRQRPSRPEPTALPVNMVACLHCGTHLPETESVKGPRGHYCSTEHRQQDEQAAP